MEMEETMKKLDEKIIEVRSEKENAVKLMADANSKIEELRHVIADAEKAEALRAMPQQVETRGQKLAKVFNDSIVEKRAITLGSNTIGSTGNVLTIPEIFKPAENKTSIVDLCRFFYGKNSDTVIPVFSSAEDFAAVTENGDFDTNSITLTAKQVTPSAFGTSVVVSDYALKMNPANLEAEITSALNAPFRKLIADKIVTAITGASVTTSVTGMTIGKLAELAITLRAKMDDAVIALNPSIYNAIIATADGNEDKVYLEELIRYKTIEGVPVVISAHMPSSTSAGATVAVGGRFTDVAVAVADQLDITPKKAVGNSSTYFDAICYVGVVCIVPANFIKLVVAS